MDRIPENVTPKSAIPASSSVVPKRGLVGVMSDTIIMLLPWSIIAALLWAAFFIKPQPVGETVRPPVLERRDQYYGIASHGDKGLWLAGSGGKIVALSPSGETRQLNTGTRKSLQDIAAWDAGRGIAIGNDGVIITTADGGETWVQITDAPRSEVANKLVRVRVAADGVAWAVGEMGALLQSTDYGQKWERRRPEQDTAWNDLALLGDGQIWVVGEFGQMLHSTDNGQTWTEHQADVESSLMAIAFRDPLNGLAVGLEGVVLSTQDGGQTWQTIDSGVAVHLFDVVWDAGRGHWIVAGDQGLWLNADASVTDIRHGQLDSRDMSWHTRALPTAEGTWFAGANVGLWTGEEWRPVSNPTAPPAE